MSSQSPAGHPHRDGQRSRTATPPTGTLTEVNEPGQLDTASNAHGRP